MDTNPLVTLGTDNNIQTLTEEEIINRLVIVFQDLAIRGRELIAQDQDENKNENAACRG